MPPTGTPDLLSRGRQTRITVDYKFIIESPCERDRRRRRRVGPPTHLHTPLARECSGDSISQSCRAATAEGAPERKKSRALIR